jgi:hypothetical protein
MLCEINSALFRLLTIKSSQYPKTDAGSVSQYLHHTFRALFLCK